MTTAHLRFTARPSLDNLKGSLLRGPQRQGCVRFRRDGLEATVPSQGSAVWATGPSVYWWGSVPRNRISNKSICQPVQGAGKDGVLKDERSQKPAPPTQWELPLFSELHVLPAVPSFFFSILLSTKDQKFIKWAPLDIKIHSKTTGIKQYCLI